MLIACRMGVSNAADKEMLAFNSGQLQRKESKEKSGGQDEGNLHFF